MAEPSRNNKISVALWIYALNKFSRHFTSTLFMNSSLLTEVSNNNI